MRYTLVLLQTSLILLLTVALQSVPVVSNLTASQRNDSSKKVDIYYDVACGVPVTVHILASSDNGASWNLSCFDVSGDVGDGISPGVGKHIVWDVLTEHPNISGTQFWFKIIADDKIPPAVPWNMVYVPTGTFIMGNTHDPGGYPYDASPLHSVTLPSYLIGKYEVTQSQWQSMMGTNPSVTYGYGPNYPVNNVSWYGAVKYCNTRSIAEGLTPVYTIAGTTNPSSWGAIPTTWNSTWDAAICNWDANGYRLPTEAEWEFAARGGTNEPDFTYSGSWDVWTVAWYSGNNTPYGPKQVGTKAPNGLGIYDMSGNVHEWCWDWYGPYSASPSYFPTGPAAASGYGRVRRGGTWIDGLSGCCVFWRSTDYPCYYYSYGRAGFRVCRSIP